MKLHLPVRLFRAVIALFLLPPVLSQAASAADIVMNDSVTRWYTVNETETLLFHNVNKVSFSRNSLESSDYITGGVIMGMGDNLISFSAIKSLSFSGNSITTRNPNSQGGAIYIDNSGELSILNNSDVIFHENKASSYNSISYGGAIRLENSSFRRL